MTLSRQSQFPAALAANHTSTVPPSGLFSLPWTCKTCKHSSYELSWVQITSHNEHSQMQTNYRCGARVCQTLSQLCCYVLPVQGDNAQQHSAQSEPRTSRSKRKSSGDVEGPLGSTTHIYLYNIFASKMCKTHFVRLTKFN